MKILVLGGAGFIGGHLVDKLVKDNEVTVIDDFSRGSHRNDKATYITCDISQSNTELYKGYDIVYNLAAKVTGIGYNEHHHPEMFIPNMLLQMIPIKDAYEAGVKKFIQVSTACVYPHDANIPTPEEDGQRGKPEPTNEGYGWAKRMGEKLAKWYSDRGMEVCVVRFFNAIGPRDYYDDETSHVVPALIKKARTGKMVVWGTGEQSRAFVDARDIATGIIKVANSFKGFDVVNIGHDNEIKMKDLASKIQLKIPCEIVIDESKPNGYERRSCDMTKLKELTNWSPEITLDQTLEDII